jgi:hypothetical protein
LKPSRYAEKGKNSVLITALSCLLLVLTNWLRVSNWQPQGYFKEDDDLVSGSGSDDDDDDFGRSAKRRKTPASVRGRGRGRPASVPHSASAQVPTALATSAGTTSSRLGRPGRPPSSTMAAIPRQLLTEESLCELKRNVTIIATRLSKQQIGSDQHFNQALRPIKELLKELLDNVLDVAHPPDPQGRSTLPPVVGPPEAVIPCVHRALTVLSFVSSCRIFISRNRGVGI